jgi:hypothetical protein
LIWRQSKLPKLNTWPLNWIFQLPKISLIKKIKHTIPANITAVISSKLVILIALNKLQAKDNAAFVTIITALSFTAFIGQIFVQSKSFELTKSIPESRKNVMLGVLWASSTFIFALIGMVTIKNEISFFRPEIENITTLLIIAFFFSALSENVASILSLPLLYNGQFKYVSNFVGTMSTLVISILILNYFNRISLNSIGILLSLFNFIYLLLNLVYYRSCLQKAIQGQ